MPFCYQFGNYQLQKNSPAIDAGLYQSDWMTTWWGEVDYVGNPRIVGAGVDMGAYEFQDVPPVGTLLMFR